MHLAHYLGLLHRAQANLAAAFREVAAAHTAEPDVAHLCHRQAGICDRHAGRLEPFARARDPELQQVVTECEDETAIQLKWLRTRIKAAAPQALVVAE